MWKGFRSKLGEKTNITAYGYLMYKQGGGEGGISNFWAGKGGPDNMAKLGRIPRLRGQ